MLGFAIGGYWGLPQICIDAQWLDNPSLIVRLTAVLPAFLLLRSGAAVGLVWLLILMGNAMAGAIESGHRQARVTASITEPWGVADRIEHRGDAVFRITGWTREAAKKRWSAPAQILTWHPEPISAITMPAGVGFYVSGKGEPPLPGQILAGPLVLSIASEASLSGGFDYRKFLTGRRLLWRGKLLKQKIVFPQDPAATLGREFVSPLRHAILARIESLLPSREASLASAVLLGLRSSDSKQISTPFTSLGLAHLFAVSGLHVGILLGIILLPGKLLHFSPRMSVAPLWIFVPIYLLLTGMPGSVVRAGGMGLLAAQARPFGRRTDSLRLLGILYWWGSLWEPIQNLDTGLQLSYLAAGGILLVGRVTSGFQLSRQRLTNFLAAGLAVGLAAQWFTMPVIAASFGFLSLASPLANLIAVPLFALAIWCVVLSLVLSLIWLPLGQSLAAISWLLLRGIAGGVSAFSQVTGGYPLGLRVPGPGLVAIWIFLTLSWLVFLSKRDGRWRVSFVAWIICPVFLVALYSPFIQQVNPHSEVEVWQFDVGQGDCGLVSFPDGWTGLIDTGGRFGHLAPAESSAMARSILPHLRRQGVRQLDLVILSHGHFDHTGGAEVLAQNIEVKSWLVAGRASEAISDFADSLQINTGRSGDVLHRWQDWELVVLYPLAGQSHAASENNWSLVVALTHHGRAQMVWSGDLELEGEELLITSESELSTTRIWKAGHHGSNTSGSADFLSLLQPELILVSCGVGNGYHHPSHGPYIVSRAAASDTVPLLRTDLGGSIRIRWESGGAIAWQTMVSSGKLPAPP